MSEIDYIEWHRFPEEKPDFSGEYIIQEREKPVRAAWYSASPKKRRFSALRTRANQQHFIALWNVIAWAKMPIMSICLNKPGSDVPYFNSKNRQI